MQIPAERQLNNVWSWVHGCSFDIAAKQGQINGDAARPRASRRHSTAYASRQTLTAEGSWQSKIDNVSSVFVYWTHLCSSTFELDDEAQKIPSCDDFMSTAEKWQLCGNVTFTKKTSPSPSLPTILCHVKWRLIPTWDAYMTLYMIKTVNGMSLFNSEDFLHLDTSILDGV